MSIITNMMSTGTYKTTKGYIYLRHSLYSLRCIVCGCSVGSLLNLETCRFAFIHSAHSVTDSFLHRRLISIFMVFCMNFTNSYKKPAFFTFFMISGLCKAGYHKQLILFLAYLSQQMFRTVRISGQAA
jgi:hypothetical protein